MKISAWTHLHSLTIYRQPPGSHPSPGRLPFFQEKVEVMTGGRGWIEHEGGWREVLPGDIIWNGPGDFTIGRSDFDDPYECLAIALKTKRRGGAGIERFSRWRDVEGARAFASECMRLFFDEGFERAFLLEYVLGQLIFRLRVHEREQEAETLPQGLQSAIRLMERRYGGECNLRELAREADWSVAHLHEMFRRHLQTSPHRMLREIRLRVARERLASGREPIKQIATECGFSDAAAFGHAFRACVGVTPGRYREQSQRLTGR